MRNPWKLKNKNKAVSQPTPHIIWCPVRHPPYPQPAHPTHYLVPSETGKMCHSGLVVMLIIASCCVFLALSAVFYSFDYNCNDFTRDNMVCACRLFLFYRWWNIFCFRWIRSASWRKWMSLTDYSKRGFRRRTKLVLDWFEWDEGK